MRNQRFFADCFPGLEDREFTVGMTSLQRV
jgi:hypothetical protein